MIRGRAGYVSLCHFALAKPVRDNKCTRSSVSLSQFLAKVHAMKAYGKMEVMYTFLTSAVSGVGWSALLSRPL